jgi:NADPH-dependent ferric siderophore reductase
MDAAPEIEHLNDHHGDAIAFVARHAGGRPDTVAAVLLGPTAGGIAMRVTPPTGEVEEVVVPWVGEAPVDVDGLRAELFGALVASRERAGDDEPLTSLERELNGSDALTTHLTEVVAARDLTPHLREVTVRGGFDRYRSLGGEEFLYLLLPPPGRTEIPHGTGFTWAGNAELPPEEQVVGAYYTVRRWRPEVQEIDLWMVLHHDHGPAGPADPRVGAASRWAATATPGDPVGLWGPRTAFEPPEGTDAHLLVADETGLAAVAALLEQFAAQPTPPRGVAVLLEVADADHRVELPDAPWAEVRWFHRDGDQPGTGTRLLDAVRATEVGPRTYALGAAESRQVTAIRRHLRDERGLAAEQVSMTGYWRRP